MVGAISRILMPLIAEVEVSKFDPPSDSRKGFIIVANHRSLLDLAVGIIVFNRWQIFPHIFIREDLFDIPIVGSLLRALGGIPAGPATGVEAIRQGLRVLRSGGILVIMPEGGIDRAGKPGEMLGKLMPGVARLASATGSPVLVGGLLNTDLAWPPGSRFPRFHLRRSRRPHIAMSTEWLSIPKDLRNPHIMTMVDSAMRDVLKRLYSS